MKTAGRCHREPCHFRDHRAEAAMPQSLLEACEHRWLVTRFQVEDTFGQETGLRDGGREEVLACDTPQDLASRARGNSRGEQCRRRAVDRAIAAAGHLVQGAERQSTLRQMLIDRLNAERQHGPRTRGSPFETLNALSKCRENRKGGGRAHVLVQLIGEMICSLFVLFMLKSQLESESRRKAR